MISNITSARAGGAEGLLFDSWFDPIEDGLRAKVRGFIETMMEEELTTALSRPRYGRRRDGGEAAVGVVGHRHGRRRRRLTGTFGPTEIVVPRARLVGADGVRSEWKSAALRAY
jgi:putative transposase